MSSAEAASLLSPTGPESSWPGPLQLSHWPTSAGTRLELLAPAATGLHPGSVPLLLLMLLPLVVVVVVVVPLLTPTMSWAER